MTLHNFIHNLKVLLQISIKDRITFLVNLSEIVLDISQVRIDRGVYRINKCRRRVVLFLLLIKISTFLLQILIAVL